MTIYERDSTQHGDVLRDMCIKMADLLWPMRQLIDNLAVMPENMAANLQRSKGMILSESLTFALAAEIGKRSAHAVMQRLIRAASERDCSLQQVVQHSPEFQELLHKRKDFLVIDKHIGLAPALADSAVSSMNNRRARLHFPNESR